MNTLLIDDSWYVNDPPIDHWRPTGVSDLAAGTDVKTGTRGVIEEKRGGSAGPLEFDVRADVRRQGQGQVGPDIGDEVDSDQGGHHPRQPSHS
jgi:hypothetical protein